MKKYKGVILVMSAVLLLVAGLATGTYYLLKPRFSLSQKDALLFDGPAKISKKLAKEVVAEVNGQPILYKDFFNQLYPYFQQQFATGINKENIKEEANQKLIQELKEDILKGVIQQEIALQKAADAGYVLTDEYISESTEKMIEQVVQEISLSGLVTEGGDAREEALDFIRAEIAVYGMKEDEYYKEFSRYLLVTDFLNKITEDIEPTDEDVEEYYNENLEAQKNDPDEVYYAPVPLIKLAGARVKHILVSLPEDQQDEYKRLMNQAKEDEAEEYLKEKLEEIKPKAQKVLDKLNDGADFEELLEEYGEDPGMKSEEYKDGYVVNEGSGSITSFEEASLSLAEGEISDLVEGPYGYHIIKAYEVMSEDTIYTLKEKKEEIKNAIRDVVKFNYMEKKMGEWESVSDIKEYVERL